VSGCVHRDRPGGDNPGVGGLALRCPLPSLEISLLKHNLIASLPMKGEGQTTAPREREDPGDEGKSPAPQRQKNMWDFFQTLPGVACRAETNPRPSKFRMPVATEANVNNQPIFNPIAKGFPFVPKEMTKKAKMLQNWLARKQEGRRTPVKGTSVIQNLPAEITLPPWKLPRKMRTSRSSCKI